MIIVFEVVVVVVNDLFEYFVLVLLIMEIFV